MSGRSWTIGIALVTAFQLSLTGCTILGAGIGALVDSGSKSAIAPAQLTSDTLQPTPRLEPGRRVKVKLTDGSTLSGRYRGIAPIPADSLGTATNGANGSAIILDLARPLRSAYTTDADDWRTARVPLDQVERIEIGSHTGRTAGMIVGGLIDLTVITAIAICAASDCFDLGFSGGWGSGY